MLCPNCNKRLEGMGTAMRNLESYSPDNGTAVVTTKCCGAGVVLKSTITFSVRLYEGLQTEDDWGMPIKKIKGVK